MHLTHLIIDDFFNNADEIRNAALRMTFPPRPDRAYYPGRNAAQPLGLPGIEKLISDIVHEPLQPARHYSYSVPRIALEGDESRASIHADFCHWSGIVFLTPDRHCQGGTHFYRHRKTGWERAPVFPGEAEEKGFATPDAAMKAVLAESNDASKWEETMMIPMKYNRLVLFRGYMWHDAGKSFGAAPEEARLILPLFFENDSG